MAAPSYTTDLVTLAIGDLGTESWDESSNAAYDDGGAMVDDSNLYYNGSSCVSAQFTKDGIATILMDYGSGVTIPADGAVLIHHLWAAPPALATLALGGVRIMVGDSLGDLYGWPCSGSDAPPSPRGGWANYAINPAIGSPVYTVGTPTGAYSVFGIAVSATAQARGNPNACNAVRYGRCTSIYEHGEAANYATFAGYAAIDSLSANKWNLLDPVKGGYEHQGLMSLGTATNAVDFRDANVNISIADTINVTAAFNRVEVNNASSNIEWTAVSISALGTTSKGNFVAVDNATIVKTSCTFTDMDSFTYQTNSTILSTTHRRCGLITQGGATMTSGTVDKPSGSVGMLASSLNAVTKYTFNSDGTGHAVDLGTVSGNTSVTWDNSDNGYTDASSGNETIVVSVDNGITLTINVAEGASTPSVYNTGTGTVDVVSGLVTITISSPVSLVGAEVRLYDMDNIPDGSLGTELSGVESHTSATYTYSGSGGNLIWIQIMLDGYEEFGQQYTMPASDTTFTALLNLDLNK